jgi:hypothetical protein
MARIAGILETRIPTAGSATDQSIGIAIAIVTSGLASRAGMKPRRTADVITALKARSACGNRKSAICCVYNVSRYRRSTYKPPTSIVARSCSFVLLSICRGMTIGTESKYTIESVITPVIAFPR